MNNITTHDEMFDLVVAFLLSCSVALIVNIWTEVNMLIFMLISFGVCTGWMLAKQCVNSAGDKL